MRVNQQSGSDIMTIQAEKSKDKCRKETSHDISFIPTKLGHLQFTRHSTHHYPFFPLVHSSYPHSYPMSTPDTNSIYRRTSVAALVVCVVIMIMVVRLYLAVKDLRQSEH
jgi:hypothetical protein